MVEHALLVALRAGAALMGALAAIWSFRLAVLLAGSRRTYLLLSIGFGVVALGAVVEGLLFGVARWDLQAAHALEAFVSAAGFAAILLAIVRSQA